MTYPVYASDRRPLWFTLLLLVAIAMTVSAAPTFEPVFRPEMITVPTADAIKVDGQLGDRGWTSATRINQFVERSPGENLPPQVKTEAYLTYDDENLYVGFICLDDPSRVRATMCQRDQYSGDDAVILLLDTFGEAAWAYEFQVNPYGVQKDLLWTNVQGEDSGFDLVWESAAQINDSGYTVEMAIPFASMRFPDKDVQKWKLDFWRIHPRESYRQYSWSANDRNEPCWPCQWGTVDGIAGVKPGKGVEILPAFVSNQSGAYDRQAASFENEDILGELSLGGKYSVSSDVTFEASLNPDFSQIEADAAQIDVNTTIALFYPERRPFFQEGSDLFRTLFNSFYTRTVNDPDLAVKGTARFDRTSLAYMVARDANSPYAIPYEESGATVNVEKSTVNVVRGLHQIGGNSQIGFMVGDRRFDNGGYGSILAGDGLLRLGKGYILDGQFVWSMTEEPEFETGMPGTFDHGKYTGELDGETYSGGAFIARLRRFTRSLGIMADFNQVDPTYRTQIGFDPWNDQRNANTYVWYTFYPENGLFSLIQPQVNTYWRWNFDGDQKWRYADYNLGADLRWAQTHVNLGLNAGSEVRYDKRFDKLWYASFRINGQPSDAWGYGLNLAYGPQPAYRLLAIGNQRTYSFELNLKPWDRIILEPSVDYIKSTEENDGHVLYRQTIFRNRLRLQLNKEFSLRLVAQYNDASERWEVDPLVTYRLTSFSVFYLGSTYDYDEMVNMDDQRNWQLTSRQYFMKIQYLFQI
jgi:hypothetical protein